MQFASEGLLWCVLSTHRSIPLPPPSRFSRCIQLAGTAIRDGNFRPPSKGGPFENTGIVIRRRPLIALSLYIHGVPLCKYRPIISITMHLISARLLIHKLYTFKWPLLLLLAVNCARQSGDRFVMVGDFQLDVTGVAPFI